MLASDVVTTARENLQDTEKEYRFSDTEMLTALTSAVRRLAIDRPDLLVASDGTLETEADVTSLSQTLIFDTHWREALVSYLCHRLFVKDSEDTHNANLAVTHLAAYKDAIS